MVARTLTTSKSSHSQKRLGMTRGWYWEYYAKVQLVKSGQVFHASNFCSFPTLSTMAVGGIPQKIQRKPKLKA